MCFFKRPREYKKSFYKTNTSENNCGLSACQSKNISDSLCIHFISISTTTVSDYFLNTTE